MHIYLSYCQHDGGWSAEVYRSNGVEVHVTEVYATSSAAKRAAQRWIAEQAGKYLGASQEGAK